MDWIAIAALVLFTLVVIGIFLWRGTDRREIDQWVRRDHNPRWFDEDFKD